MKKLSSHITSFLLVIYFVISGVVNASAQDLKTSNEGVLVVKNVPFSTYFDFENKKDARFYNRGDAYFHADFHNNGTVDFMRPELPEIGLTSADSEPAGTTWFIGQREDDFGNKHGKDLQKIDGEEVSVFYNVVFNNQGNNSKPYQLSGMVDVEGTAEFLRGIVNNEDFPGMIYFIDNGNHTEDTSDDSHVNGPVGRIGGQDFQFPIGHGRTTNASENYYRTAAITNLDNPNNPSEIPVFEFEYFLVDPNDRGMPTVANQENIIHIDNREFWAISNPTKSHIPEESDAFGNPVPTSFDVTLTWRSDSFGRETTQPEVWEAAERESVSIVRWDNDLNVWVDEGGEINSSTQSITTKLTKLSADPDEPTYITLAAKNLDDCEPIIYNAITPNGDGINDYFRVEGECIVNLKVQIFNRWGRLVFASNDYYFEYGGTERFEGYARDGKMVYRKNEPLPTGTYFYILEYEYAGGSEGKALTNKKSGYLYISN